ncbi:MAG: hypothetical protein QOG85_2705, partial [Gaiellaceae bacterium]|nr:hypothetical protein [Gaiellaceae bacterium]
LAALTVGAWMYGGAKVDASGLGKCKQPPTGLVLCGVGSGTSVVVRHNSRTGAVLFRGALTSGQVEHFNGTRFYVSARTPAGFRVAHAAGVTVVHG